MKAIQKSDLPQGEVEKILERIERLIKNPLSDIREVIFQTPEGQDSPVFCLHCTEDLVYHYRKEGFYNFDCFTWEKTYEHIKDNYFAWPCVLIRASVSSNQLHFNYRGYSYSREKISSLEL